MVTQKEKEKSKEKSPLMIIFMNEYRILYILSVFFLSIRKEKSTGLNWSVARKEAE